ncbi:hypothetical protein [Edwardsiella hoshinae]|nr:hypothetical protein [Edwardsiella hoshinae]
MLSRLMPSASDRRQRSRLGFLRCIRLNDDRLLQRLAVQTGYHP